MGLTEPIEILKGLGGLNGHNYLYLVLIFPVEWIIYLVKKNISDKKISYISMHIIIVTVQASQILRLSMLQILDFSLKKMYNYVESL